MANLQTLNNKQLAATRRKLEAAWILETDETKACLIRQRIDQILSERERRLTWRK